jgi:cobalt-precorrin-5B (C1)-methyltransferase
MARKPEGTLRKGWTTGACATAATKAAWTALLTGEFPDPVEITLPKGETPGFALARQRLAEGSASASIVKDAGDDPDVTHLALVTSTVCRGPVGSGVVFKAGTGVGMVTKEGLPIPPGEPAINPVPRQMMREVIAEVAETLGEMSDVVIEISIANGESLATKTWNPRLGIVGGLSVLGTTGVVIPYSCSSWIHSIHRGIDVARAADYPHVAGATGSTSEKTVQDLYGLDETALLDMGDFAGGLLKYIKRNPVPRLTIIGGFAKITKLAQGFMDLHSGRSQVDFSWMADQIEFLGGSASMVEQVRVANTAKQVLDLCGEKIGIAHHISNLARAEAIAMIAGTETELEVLVVDRQGNLVGASDFRVSAYA